MRDITELGSETMADEGVEGMDLAGRRVVITGAASGIGVETAPSLARVGAEVTIAVRDTAVGERVAAEISASVGGAVVHVGALDLLDRASIAAFIDRWEGPLRVLVNNAGVMALPELTLTDEGWETQFATNHIGHVSLALGLHDALTATDDARIVSVSSSGHRGSPVVFDDLHFERRDYEP